MRGVKGMARSSEVKRKLVHIGNGIWAFVLAFIPRWLAILVVVIALIAVLSMNPRLWKGAFEAMARDIDRQVGILVGPLIYVITVLILVLLFDLRVAGAAFAMMAFGDGFAGLVGATKGRRALWNGKTIEGTAAFLSFGFMFSSLCVLLINTYNPDPRPIFLTEWLDILVPTSLMAFLVTMVLVTIIAAVVELFGGSKLDDNASVPLSVALLLSIFW